MTIRAAISWLGVVLIPMNFVEDDIASGKLLLPFGAPILSSNAYYVANPERKAHFEFVKLLRETRTSLNAALTSEDHGTGGNLCRIGVGCAGQG